jgi:hypothetical protein
VALRDALPPFRIASNSTPTRPGAPLLAAAASSGGVVRRRATAFAEELARRVETSRCRDAF